MRNIIKSKSIQAFILSLLLGCTIILPNMVINHGIFTLSADYNYQQIPFGEIMNYSIKQGSILWTWFNELGSNFIGTFSFYNLLSPFNLISYLFSPNMYPYLCGYLVILKFGISGLTSYLFLKRYVKNKNYAIIGSVLYSFSGYQLNNLLFHFHDSICLFPLIPYTLDNLMYDKKKNRFMIAIFILSITNWFMFIGQCVFIVIYTIIKLILKEYRASELKQLIIEFMLGILLSSFILIPSLLFTISNPRVNTAWEIKNMLMHSSLRYIEIIRSIFFPNEIMAPRPFLVDMNYDSVELYLPFIGFALVVPYIIKKPKTWKSILAITLLIFMMIPILNSSFFLFTTKYYARWFYMAALIFSLLSIKTIEENLKITSGLVTSLSALIFMVGIYIYMSKNHSERTIIFDKNYVILILVFMIINIIVLSIIYKQKSRDKLLLILPCIYVAIWGNYTIYKYSETGLKYNENYNSYINSYKNIKLDGQRINTINCVTNLGNILRIPSIQSFNTNINGTNFEFYSGIDYMREVSTNISETDKLNDFLSIKYLIACDKKIENNNYKIKEQNDEYVIYENKNYKEMGQVLRGYTSVIEFKNMEPEKKREVLLDKIVLTEEQINTYKSLYDKTSKIVSNDFEYTKNGFESNIDVTEETLILYTVPYDIGFKATINGIETKIEKVDNGLMAIKANKGTNRIIFKYTTPGLKVGTAISITILVILLTNLCIKRLLKQKNNTN